jgi:RNA polymerase sigma-70 factor (ECF subfamily)
MNGSTAILLSDFRAKRSAAKQSTTAAQGTPNGAAPADGMLVAAARRGDVKAFESLYRLHSSRVMGLCLRMTRQHDAAEDCVQQTFIKAWRSLGAFEGRSAFSTWIHSIAMHVVLGHLRSQKPWLTTSLTAADDDESEVLEESREPNTGEVIDIERALMTLPEGARSVVVLQTIYGYSHEEVAGMLGIAVGTSKAQLHRARHLLRAVLNIAESDNE